MIGMRGTDSLAPEQRPRSRKMRGRAQPYRRRKPRTPGPTLDAMLRGAPVYLPNPMDLTRQALRSAVAAEHTPYLAHLRKTADSDTALSDRDAVEAMLDSPRLAAPE